MDNIPSQLQRLRSSNKNTRYDACEELRVISAIPPAAVSALEEASHDTDPLVADAAKRALEAHRPPAASNVPAGTASPPANAFTLVPVPARPTTARDMIDPLRLYNPAVPAGRLLFLWGWLIYPLLVLIAIGLCAGAADLALYSGNETPISDALLAFVQLAFFAASILIIIRRLKDLGKSGWYILVGLIPLANIVFALWLLLAPGTQPSVAPHQVEVPAQAGPTIPASIAPLPPRQCARCGAELPDGARFCMTCGEKAPGQE